MQVDWISPSATGQSGLQATPGDYDAIRFPVDLLLDREPRLRSPDRLAVAAALLFGARMEGPFRPPAPVSPLVAKAIEAHLFPADVRVAPVDLTARALPRGSTVMFLTDVPPVADTVPVGMGRQRFTVLQAERSDRLAGASVGVDKLVVPSNLWLFTLSGRHARARALLALGTLFAEDQEADRLALPLERSEFDAVYSIFGPLLAATGLGLIGVPAALRSPSAP